MAGTELKTMDKKTISSILKGVKGKAKKQNYATTVVELSNRDVKLYGINGLHIKRDIGLEWSCSSPRWDNLPSEHQRNPLLRLILWYMYWGQKYFSEKIETYQYMQKKEVNVLMFFSSFRFIGKKKVP